MSPLLPATALALCVLLAAAGLRLARSVPEGAQRILGLSEVSRRERRSLLGALRTSLGRRFGRRVLNMMSERRIAAVRHRIDSAGRPGGMTVESYAGVKAASTILFGGIGLVLFALLGSPILVPALALLGWLQIDISLDAQSRRRQARIDRDLPDFLDVLVVTVGAGLGFRDALGRVAEALGGPLGQECRMALQQMGYGAARRSAFEGIRERNDSESLSQFMTALLQAEELGAPLGEALRGIAVDMRKSFAQRARRDAQRTIPRITLVTTTFVVPAILILLVGALYVGIGTDLTQLFG